MTFNVFAPLDKFLPLFRLITLIDTVTECIAQHGTHNVIVNEWNGL